MFLRTYKGLLTTIIHRPAQEADISEEPGRDGDDEQGCRCR